MFHVYFVPAFFIGNTQRLRNRALAKLHTGVSSTVTSTIGSESALFAQQLAAELKPSISTAKAQRRVSHPRLSLSKRRTSTLAQNITEALQRRVEYSKLVAETAGKNDAGMYSFLNVILSLISFYNVFFLFVVMFYSIPVLSVHFRL